MAFPSSSRSLSVFAFMCVWLLLKFFMNRFQKFIGIKSEHRSNNGEDGCVDHTLPCHKSEQGSGDRTYCASDSSSDVILQLIQVVGLNFSLK